MRIIYFLGLLLLGYSCVSTTNDVSISEEKLEKTLEELASKALANAKVLPLDSTQIPRTVDQDGRFRGSVSRDWTSGFYPGTLWALYRHSGKEELMTAAQNWTAFQEKEKWDTHTHDLGFKIFCSFGEGLKVEQNEAYKDVIVQASKTLIKRYNPTVGAIRSWDWNKDVWQFPVIIDNMMNLEMLFEASMISGDSIYHKIAYQHARTTLENHFRPDNSSYHVIDYDTLSGDVRNRHTHQGAAHESAWSRGQAWGLYGFAMSYRYTKDPTFLAQANKIANFFFEHPNLPEDHVPYWDFDAPDIPNAYRDASAAAIAASGLLELSMYDLANKEKYVAIVDTILTTLSSEEYVSSTQPFLLDHSVGSVPGEFEVDVPLSYADYYYVQALIRRLAIEQNRLQL